MELLQDAGLDDLSGKKAVVIGRSNLVGKPLSTLLTAKNATVTVLHSKSPDAPAISKEADIVVAAIGRPKLIDASYIKDGAVVIDVGINRVDGHLCGDVDFENVKDIASVITPVPKGVGPMTVCMLLANTIKSYKERENLG
jgi:methylenetetrahydrofolate dehydrogenase (NADP+)/methenyltetrahydrofolate cyclohydrolase